MNSPYEVRQLQVGDIATCRAMLDMFGIAFDDVPSYSHAQPDDAYLQQLLASDTFIALAALRQGEVVGGLAAYVFPKFEQACKEVFVYDLAVREDCRRQGIATALMEALKRIGKRIGAHVLMVPAEPVDAPAVALYSKLGSAQDVLWFDIEVE